MRAVSRWSSPRGFGLPAPPRMPTVGRPPNYRMPRPPTMFPQGPELYRQTRKNVVHLGGPGPAPSGFVVASTSLSEWFWYWASMVELDPEADPRQPPFNGGLLWLYQSSELGSFTRQRGSAVVDFFYKTQYPYLAVRIQTYQFHLAADTMKQAFDRHQLVALAGRFDVVDVYEGDFISDATGAAAIKLLKRTLGLVQEANPIRAGTVYLRRNALTTQR